MIIYSHRGHSRTFPENSMDGFREAVAAGVDGIETDIRQTADRQLILFHDRRLPTGQPVREASHQEVCRAVGFAVPTVDEIIEWNPPVQWLLELKATDATKLLGDRLRRWPDKSRVTVISFWHEAVQSCAAAAGIGYGITMGHQPAFECLASILAEMSRQPPQMVVWNFEFLHESVAARTLEAGLQCVAYNVEDKQELEHCRAWKLSGVIMDDVRIALPTNPAAQVESSGTSGRSAGEPKT